jgi:hypothetical protein
MLVTRTYGQTSFSGHPPTHTKKKDSRVVMVGDKVSRRPAKFVSILIYYSKEHEDETNDTTHRLNGGNSR